MGAEAGAVGPPGVGLPLVSSETGAEPVVLAVLAEADVRGAEENSGPEGGALEGVAEGFEEAGLVGTK